MNKLIDKFGKFVLLFFLLQINFVIKGSNAIPGNSHVKPSSSSNNMNQDQTNDGMELNNQQQQNIRDGSENVSVSLQDSKYSNEMDNLKNNEEPKLKEDEVSLAQNVILLSSGLKQIRLNELINENFDEEYFKSSPNSHDRLNYSMLRSSFPLRPKTISRQSLSISGDGGLDHDWIEINSEFSGSSRIAKMIFSMSFVTDHELQPITYDQLCRFLDESGDKEMCDGELLIICKRIIKESETFIKALKDLPLYIQTTRSKQNAIKINSILYSYLGNSGECYKDLLNNEHIENGSGSSRCSSRGSDSSISSKVYSSDNDNGEDNFIPVQTSRPSSDIKNEANNLNFEVKEKKAEIENEHEQEQEEDVNFRVIDEINDAQSHVPHQTLPKLLNISDNFILYHCNSFGRFISQPPFHSVHNHLRPSSSFPFLSPVMEEKKSSENYNERGMEIEEVD